MHFNLLAAASAYCSNLNQFYVIVFAFSAVAKLAIAAAKALLFRDYLTNLAVSNGTAYEAC